MLRKNDTVRAIIEGYSSEGLGIARVEGQVVFVHGAVRGEDCDIRILKVLKNIAYGKAAAIHTPSPDRQTPDCPYYGRCGGCDFRHMSYTEELWAKRQRVQDALTRIGGSDAVVEEILGAADTKHYRNKSQYPVGPDGSVGFYRSRTHQVTDVAVCRIQKPQADAAAEALRQYIRRCGVSCYDEVTGRGLLRHLYVRTNAAGESLICLLVNGDALPCEAELVALLRQYVPAAVGVVLGVNTRRGNVILGDRYRTLWGVDTITDTLCGLTFRLSVPSFYQVNRDQAERLYERAVEFAGLTGTETVLDLYCGAGTITQVMARRAGEVIGAEIVPEAIDDAMENARHNGIENVRFFCGDAAAAAADFAARGLRPDVICVDPPRRGLAPEVVEAAAAMGPERIVYVSCDPATLGRDVKRFAGHGYRVARAAAVDLFPRTAHVETVCVLSKLSEAKHHISVQVDMDELDVTAAESKATYEEIQAWVQEKYGFHVSHLNIAKTKRKCDIIERQNYNLPKNENSRSPETPKEKEEAIIEAFRHFQMI
ncbi:MAG: 23S rRNA (uracil(1939)-C(5))-methyltransferase RlmD [Ruminococcaceae bacterium]|jgi:23S rRNA (uracil1939-C5)-methyltransferase|nr:23S rRNA (uracil(1939)-C(5))-methyltransferase RlmD [Oscillospiraceae bacterium]